jgi:hypothetical protein
MRNFNAMNKRYCFIILFVISTGCMVQHSSLKKVKDSDVPQNDLAVIKYYGSYKMNMSKSEDIIISIMNLKTQAEYSPNSRSSDGMTVINAPEGEYILSKLIMRETEFTKCLCKGTDKYIYGFSNRNCTNFNTSGLVGNASNGGLLLGEKYLLVEKENISPFKIRKGEIFIFDSLLIKGKVESLFKDLPNLEIVQVSAGNNSNEIKIFSKDSVLIERKNTK